MAIYKRLLVTGPNGTTANSVTDTAATNFYGYKNITLEEAFTTAAAAAERIAFVKKNPTVVIKGDADYSGTPGTAPDGATLESWSITEKTHVYQTTSGTTTTTNTSTHVILKYTIKIQDFWVQS